MSSIHDPSPRGLPLITLVPLIGKKCFKCLTAKLFPHQLLDPRRLINLLRPTTHFSSLTLSHSTLSPHTHSLTPSNLTSKFTYRHSDTLITTAPPTVTQFSLQHSASRPHRDSTYMLHAIPFIQDMISPLRNRKLTVTFSSSPQRPSTPCCTSFRSLVSTCRNSFQTFHCHHHNLSCRIARP